MKLNEIKNKEGATHAKKRVGRGPGSGLGKTGGRGVKGQKSRSGVAINGFEGGQMSIYRRLPKRGFNNKFALNIFAVNVGDLENTFEAGAEVTPELLAEKGLAKGVYDELKILGNGELTKKLKVSAHRFSKSAEEKINAAGGTVDRLPARRTPDERVAALKAEVGA